MSSQSTIYAATEACVDLGVFAVLSKDDRPKTAEELATATGAEPVMLGMSTCRCNVMTACTDMSTLPARLLKHLCAMGTIAEAGPDTYRRTGFSTALSTKRFADAYPCMYVQEILHLFQRV